MSNMICTLSLSIPALPMTTSVHQKGGRWQRQQNLKWYRHGGDGWSTCGGYGWYRYAAHGRTTYADFHWYSLARLLTLFARKEQLEEKLKRPRIPFAGVELVVYYRGNYAIIHPYKLIEIVAKYSSTWGDNLDMMLQKLRAIEEPP